MPGLFVHHSRPVFSAFLRAWGRADDGWWGLIVWEQRIRSGGAVRTIAYAAWVPAERLAKPGWAAGETPARMTLPPDRGEWPEPPDFEGWFIGPWTTGVIPALAGAEVVTGPAWRR